MYVHTQGERKYYTDIHIYTQNNRDKERQTSKYINTCIETYIYTYIDTYIDTYKHMYTNIHTHIDVCANTHREREIYTPTFVSVSVRRFYKAHENKFSLCPSVCPQWPCS